MAKNSKVKKIIAAIAIVGVAAGAIFGGLALANRGGSKPGPTPGPGTDPNPPIVEVQQLDRVQNIQYNEAGYKFTWDDVANADTYNIKINNTINEEGVTSNEYGYYPQTQNETMTVQVQAVDSTGKYSKSEWSDEYSYTMEMQESLMTSVMNYARENVNGELKNVVSARVNDSILVLNVITRRNGEDKITEILSDINKGVDTTSLAKVIESNPIMYSSKDYTLAVDDNGKAYNSMQYLLKSNLQGTKLQRWKDNGFKVEVLSSNTALNYNDPEGNDFTVHTVLKLTNGNDVRYFEVEYGCHIKFPSNLEENVTYSLQNTSDRSISEGVMHEITGDYLDVLNQNTTAKTQASYYSNNEGMSY